MDGMVAGAVRRPVGELRAFAERLFIAAGLDPEKAVAVARLLVLTDMMGRATHGLAQCGAYLEQVAAGQMTVDGQPEVVRDTGSTLVWDGGYRPGLWLMEQAMEEGLARLPDHGVFTFAMRRSHHVGCLAALAKAATDRGCYVMLASSGPHTRVVAPFGGRQGLFSPNPFAFGFPTTGHPVLVDMCASITTVSMTREKTAAGTRFAHPWLMDHEGRPTDDPSVMEAATDRGSLLLLGGMEYGHKGFGLALMVEALTQGLAGHGRLDRPTRWGASVFMQLMDPGAFAGREAFTAQTGFFADQCRANDPLDPAHPVRLPGEQASRNIERAAADGILVSPATATTLRDWAERLGVEATPLP